MKLAIYNLLILILIPVFALRIFFKSLTDSDYTKHFANRLGYSLSNLRQKNKKLFGFMLLA